MITGGSKLPPFNQCWLKGTFSSNTKYHDTPISLLTHMILLPIKFKMIVELKLSGR